MTKRFVRAGVAVLSVIGLLVAVGPARAGNFNRNGSVGGISISADGVVGAALVEAREALLQKLREELRPAPGEMARKVPLRKISLRALEATLSQYMTRNAGSLPDEIKYLGGLQRIEYILVYPELNDIVLAGPAEGWTVHESGTVVGETTGRPVLLLDDLLVALRSVHFGRQQVISCSIEPTAEGYRNLTALLSQTRSLRGVNPRELEARIKQAFGPQMVKLAGVPADSHFARVLVAADYKMKRLAMKLDRSPVRGLPSYLDLIQNVRSAPANVNPRWWLACNYDPIQISDDGLVFRISGPGVKVMTEEDFVAADGTVQPSGQVNPYAQRWADLMTEKYDELSSHDLVFAELRNLMDMTIAAAIIEKHELLKKVALDIPYLLGENPQLLPDSWNAPRLVEPHCSFLRTRNGWIVTASGGVQIDPWTVTDRTEVRPEVVQVRRESMGLAGHGWWWN